MGTVTREDGLGRAGARSKVGVGLAGLWEGGGGRVLVGGGSNFGSNGT